MLDVDHLGLDPVRVEPQSLALDHHFHERLAQYLHDEMRALGSGVVWRERRNEWLAVRDRIDEIEEQLRGPSKADRALAAAELSHDEEELDGVED